ncbi:retrotransposon protein, putative, ty1-copia subclass [Tanacetum coccineum]|uniref:Retrotransposon protein, putative, ty1-copia subclass n=1 Tax=Tanacetum coccineum TaxID=301880 RepID=A0ABQ4YY19_9ASTR
MAATQTTNNNSIWSILDKEKLNGSNFLDWYRNLRIVLRNEQSCATEKKPYLKRLLLQLQTGAVSKRYHPLKNQETCWTLVPNELFKTVKAFHACKHEEGQSVSTYLNEARVKRSWAFYGPQAQDPPPAKKEHPAKDTECHHYHKTGHWKRNCPLYLAELKKNKGLRGYRKLNKGALDLYVGNGNTAAVEAIGSFDLILLSGMILVLDNCHFSPTITRGVISLSRLWDNVFCHKFMDNGAILVSKDNIFYFNAFSRDGIFEIDMHNHISNEHSIYTCSNKKSKHNLDSTFLWHCRLGHINKKRIEKLQHDGLLKSIDKESFDVCVSCISGKMARKPFTFASERADALLGIIHSDVCGPFRTTSREESIARILNMVPTKKVNKTPSEMWHGKVPNLSYLKTVSYQRCKMGATIDFNEIQREDAQPSNNTSQHQHEVEHDDVDPQTDVIHVRRSARIPQAPERYGFYIDAEEHELGDHGEPPNYRVALLDPESEKYIKAIRIIIAIAAYYDYEIWQMDIKTTFLNGRLNEDVYMVQPEGYVNPKHPRRVYKLQRSVYGLKQAFRSWNKRFDEEIKRYGFTQNLDELCINTSKRGTIPMQPNVDLSKSQGHSTSAEVKQMKGIPYASAVGSIKYAARCTRPNVAFYEKLTSRYQQNPGESHWTAVNNILKYLRITKDMFLVYGGDSITELSATCYTDASWETDRDDLRSQSGFIFVMNGGAVDWKSYKQSTTAMSSIEAEYIAAAEAAMEAIWIRKFIYGLGVVPSIDKPMDMYCDNTGAITIADEPGVQKDNNLADLFTKPMPCTKHVDHARSIRLRPAVFHMAQQVVPTTQLVPRYHTIGRCNNYALLQSIPCSPECKIVGIILLDHSLSYALTATADVPVVYLQQFWRTVSKVPDTEDTIKFMMDTEEFTHTVDISRVTLHLPVETPGNPFVALVNIQTIEAFMNMVGYQGVVDKVSAFYTKNLAQPWQTIFKVFNRYLITRTFGHDHTNINILQLFHVVINRTNVDYVALLWWDFMNNVFLKKEAIQYPRFIKLIIADLIKKFPNIPQRID